MVVTAQEVVGWGGGKPPPPPPPLAAQKLPLGRGPALPVWDDRLGAHGQRQGLLPSSVWTRHRAVKQGKSGGSVGTTSKGKGKGSGEGKMGQGGRGTTAYGGKGSKGRAASGDRPIGATSCGREQHTKATCQPPPPPCSIHPCRMVALCPTSSAVSAASLVCASHCPFLSVSKMLLRCSQRATNWTMFWSRTCFSAVKKS